MEKDNETQSSDELKSPTWIYNYVVQLINEVKNVRKESRQIVAYHQDMAQKHSAFFSKYPRLFSVILDDGEDFDMNQLRGMLTSLGQIQSGEKDYEDVNKQYGQTYFDKYVAPHVDMSKEKK